MAELLRGGRPRQEKRPLEATIVDTSSLMEDISRDTAMENLEKEKTNSKGVSGFFKKIWKHNLFAEYYQQKEILKVKKGIIESGNIFINEEDDIKAHEAVMFNIIDRFRSDYDDALHEEAGEKKESLGETPEDIQTKDAIISLLKEYAGKDLSDPDIEATFVVEKNRIFSQLQEQKAEVLDSGQMYADNILELVKQVQRSVQEGQSLEEVTDSIKITIGKAKAGVRTEAQFNIVERIFNKLSEGRFGKYLVDNGTLASGMAIAYCLTTHLSRSLVRSKFAQWSTLGATTLMSGGISALKESQRIESERSKYFRDMAQSKKFDAGKTKEQNRLEQYRYQAVDSNSLALSLGDKIYDPLDLEKDEIKDLNVIEFKAALEALAEIEARISISDRQKIDLISYSDIKLVEQERWQLDILRAKAKIGLKKQFEKKDKEDILKEVCGGKNIEDFLLDVKEAKIRQLNSGEVGGENSIEAKNRLFKKMKRKEVAKAALKGAVVGLTVGGAVQEGLAFTNEQTGFIEQLVKENVGEHGGKITPLENLHRMYSDSDIKFTALSGEQIGLIGDAGEGKMESISDNIRTDNTVQSVSEIKNLSSHDFARLNEDKFKTVERDLWYNNDTVKADFNELKLQGAGINQAIINKSGDFVFSIKGMDASGSFAGSQNVDVPQGAIDEKLRLLLSLSKDTQNQVFEVMIGKDGIAVIDKDSEMAKILFDKDGNFLGKYGEVVEMGKVDENGIQHVNVISTMVGNGVEHIPTQMSVNVESNILEHKEDIKQVVAPTLPLDKPILETTSAQINTEMAPPVAVGFWSRLFNKKQKNMEKPLENPFKPQDLEETKEAIDKVIEAQIKEIKGAIIYLSHKALEIKDDTKRKETEENDIDKLQELLSMSDQSVLDFDWMKKKINSVNNKIQEVINYERLIYDKLINNNDVVLGGFNKLSQEEKDLFNNKVFKELINDPNNEEFLDKLYRGEIIVKLNFEKKELPNVNDIINSAVVVEANKTVDNKSVIGNDVESKMDDLLEKLRKLEEQIEKQEDSGRKKEQQLWLKKYRSVLEKKDTENINFDDTVNYITNILPIQLETIEGKENDKATTSQVSQSQQTISVTTDNNLTIPVAPAQVQTIPSTVSQPQKSSVTSQDPDNLGKQAIPVVEQITAEDEASADELINKALMDKSNKIIWNKESKESQKRIKEMFASLFADSGAQEFMKNLNISFIKYDDYPCQFNDEVLELNINIIKEWSIEKTKINIFNQRADRLLNIIIDQTTNEKSLRDFLFNDLSIDQLDRVLNNFYKISQEVDNNELLNDGFIFILEYSNLISFENENKFNQDLLTVSINKNNNYKELKDFILEMGEKYREFVGDIDKKVQENRGVEKDSSEVIRHHEIEVAGDLDGQLDDLFVKLKESGLVDVDGQELKWKGGNGELVFVGDICGDRAMEGFAILDKLQDLKKQAEKDSGKVEWIAGNHEQMLFNYFLNGDAIDADSQYGDPYVGILEPVRFASDIELKQDLITYLNISHEKERSKKAKFAKDKSIIARCEEKHQEVLSNMRNNIEGRKVLENLCEYNLVIKKDDNLILHTQLTERLAMLLARSKDQNDLEKKLDRINTIFQEGLRKYLINGEGLSKERDSEFFLYYNIFLETNNRQNFYNPILKDRLRQLGINAIIHGHSRNSMEDGFNRFSDLHLLSANELGEPTLKIKTNNKIKFKSQYVTANENDRRLI